MTAVCSEVSEIYPLALEAHVMRMLSVDFPIMGMYLLLEKRGFSGSPAHKVRLSPNGIDAIIPAVPFPKSSCHTCPASVRRY